MNKEDIVFRAVKVSTSLTPGSSLYHSLIVNGKKEF